MKKLLFIYLVVVAIIIPTPKTAHATTLLRVVAPTVATQNPGGGAIVKRIPVTTPYGHAQSQLRVIRSVKGETDPITQIPRTYYLVYLPYRPNGLKGWVSSDRVQVVTTQYRVVINRAKRNAVLYYGKRVVLRWRVVVGTSSTPTPNGEFQIYGKSTQNHGFDGTGIITFGYSNVIKQFDGGNGMVAIHGRSGASFRDPLGSARSHGCVRSNNNIVDYLLARLPIGTPVSVR